MSSIRATVVAALCAVVGFSLAAAPAASEGSPVEAPVEVIIDNSEAELTPSEAWEASTWATGYFGDDYAIARPDPSNPIARWRANLPEAGEYVVQVMLPDGQPNRSASVEYRVHHAGEETTFQLDQREDGGYWRTGVGPLSFSADGDEYVEVVVNDAAEPVSFVNIDAVRVVEPYVPMTPGGLEGSWLVSGIHLSWEPVGETDHYLVKRSATASGPYETIASVAAEAEYVDQDIDTEEYYYTVVSVGPDGESAPSDALHMTRPPAPDEKPAAFQATGGNQQVTLSWNPVDDAEHYIVRRTVGDGAYETIADRVTRTHFTDGQLDNDTNYRYVVSAANAGRAGPQSDEVSATPDGQPLAMPHGLVATPREGAVELSWLPTNDADSYIIQRSSALSTGNCSARYLAATDHRPPQRTSGLPDCPRTRAIRSDRPLQRPSRPLSGWERIARVSDSSYIDEDVEAGVTYHYVVRPQNEDGQGELTSYQASVVPGSSAELVIDNSEAELSGAWTTTNTERGYRGRDAAVAQSLEPCSDHLAVDAHVTASSVFDSARGPKNAVDGACADDSRWLSATDDPTPTLTIDLDSTTNIERLDVYSGFRWADINPAHVLVDFTIEAHTEAGWEQVAEFTDNTDSKASWEGQVAADRIRLVITDPSRTTPDVARIYEVAVHEASEDLATAVFPPGSEIVGDYSVWAWFPHGDANAASDAPFTVVHADGEDRVTVDQRGAGGYWHRLGNEVYTFDASAGHHVRLDNIADGYVVADAVRLLPAGETPTASYGVDWSDPRQVIEGMSVEILFDCLAPGGQENCTEERVPDTLTSSERERWYQDMLTGIRNIRLAMGLYLRGTDDEERLITSRYPGQLEDIAETAQESGADVTPTYWSPAPYFKSSDSFIGGGVRSFDNSTLADLADAMSTDITTLKEHGIPVRNWSLQNEPQNRPLNVSPGSYSMSYYAPADYVTTFKTVGSQIRSEHPEVRLFGPDTGKGTNWANAIASDPEIMELIDAWSWHLRPAELLTAPGTAWDNAQDRPQINTEFSYTGGGSDFTNTAKNILNHFIYYDSPTWYWLHALQPTNAGEFAANRALGVWRPPTDDDFSGEFSDLPVGHWRFIDHNWNPLAGFVKLMPHDSVRYPVLGENPKNDGQLMAFEGPDGERGVVILNDSDTPADFEIDLGDVHALSGHGFSLNDRFADLGTVEDDVLTTTLEPESLQFWVSEASS